MPEMHQITLNKSTSEAVNAHLAAGEFDTPDDVVKAGLDLLELRKAKLEALRSALKEGEESGYIENFDWEEHRRKLNAEHIKNGQISPI